MNAPKTTKLLLQSFAINLLLLIAFTGTIGLGVYIIGFMVGRFYGLRTGLNGARQITISASLAPLLVWIPFVLGTSGFGILLLPAFAAYALFVLWGLYSGQRTRRKGNSAAAQSNVAAAWFKD